MFSLADLKSFFHLESELEKESRYKTILNRIELLKAEQNDLIEEHEEEKLIALAKIKNLNKVSIPEADELSKAINTKYNTYFTNFINRLDEIKKEYNKEEKNIDKLFQNKDFEKAQQIKDQEFLQSFLLLAQAYKAGQIDDVAFKMIKDNIVKGGYAVGTIRNWADGKYKKDLDRYGKDVWTKVSHETSGSGASESALRTEIEKVHDLFDLKGKIESIPERYKDSPLAKMAKKIYAEKDKRDLEYQSKRSVDDLKRSKNRYESRYISEEKKAFYFNRFDKLIAAKEMMDKLSPMEIEEKGLGVFEVGTIRIWADGKYIKEADGTWRKMPSPLTSEQISWLNPGDTITVVEDDRIGDNRIISIGFIDAFIEEDGKRVGFVVENEDTGTKLPVRFDDMSEIKLYKESVKGFLKIKASTVPFPENLAKVKTTKSLGGSSDVQMAEWDGKFFALKAARPDKGEDGKEQIKYEYIANAIYKAMGFSSPKGKIYNGGEHLLNEFLEGKELGKYTYYNLSEERKVKALLQSGYVLDALLANWDVVGGNADNILVGSGGAKVSRIDNGGCFDFRARGGKKDFGMEVKELDTLKENNKKWFGDISEEQIQTQINSIVNNRDKILTTLEWEANVAGLDADKVKALYSAVDNRISWLKGWKSKESAERGEYLSGTTNKYFSNWDSVQVPSTVDKNVLKYNIVKKEKENENDYRNFAEKRGISVEKYKELLQERIESLIKQTDFFRATKLSVLDKIIHTDGRWKSQFETNTSEGCLDRSHRSHAENLMFGTRDDTKHEPEKRCIYGYWSDNKNGVLTTSGTNPPPNEVVSYGTVTFKIKKEVALKKATLTFGDSLGTNNLPVLAQKPHFTAFPLRYSRDPLDEWTPGEIHKWKTSGGSYTEVQYHEGIRMEDVESVHLSPNNRMSTDNINEVLEHMMYYAMKKGTFVPVKYYNEK